MGILTINYLKSLIVLFPLIAGLIRFNKIDRDYRPFIYLLILYFLGETAGYLSAKIFRTNAVSSNIFSLVECALIFYQFHRWGFLKKKPRVFYACLTSLAILWSIENIALGLITSFPPYFKVFYAFLIVLLSVNQVNYLIIHDSKSLFRNGQFLICVAFIIFFMYQILYEGSLFINSDHGSHDVARSIVLLFADMNIFTNLLFAVAVFFIPVKDNRSFTLDKID